MISFGLVQTLHFRSFTSLMHFKVDKFAWSHCFLLLCLSFVGNLLDQKISLIQCMTVCIWYFNGSFKKKIQNFFFTKIVFVHFFCILSMKFFFICDYYAVHAIFLRDIFWNIQYNHRSWIKVKQYCPELTILESCG